MNLNLLNPLIMSIINLFAVKLLQPFTKKKHIYLISANLWVNQNIEIDLQEIKS